jgi:spore coat protein CotH
LKYFAAALIAIGVAVKYSMVACAANPPGHELFTEAAVRQFKIHIEPTEWNKLKADNRTYVHASIAVDDEAFKLVGVRLKGQGSFRPLEDRPSLAVKFDEFVDGQKFCGLTKIMLNNSSQDRSYLSEYICTSLYRDAGVPVGRVTFAHVELNERDLGFYVLIEAMNKTFLRQHFRNPNGPLYEAYAKDIDRTLDQDSGPPTDQSDIKGLVAAARSPMESRMTALDDVLDVDNFFSSLAVCMLIAQHDSYALNRNNYRLYREPDSHRFTMIPHGIDGSFTRNAIPLLPPADRVLTRAVLESPEGLGRYKQRVTTLYTNIFKVDVISNRVYAASSRLAAAARNEQERTNFLAHATRFIRKVQERYEDVTGQLDGLPGAHPNPVK